MQPHRRADPFLTDILGAGFRWTTTSPQDVLAAQALTDQGFYIVDTRVTLEKKLPSRIIAPIPQGYAIRASQPTDEEQVTAIASTAFTCNRFYNDPAILPLSASKIKEMWARNFFRGMRGDIMVVATQGKKVVGFNLVLKKDDVLVIDLIAVDAAHRQRGLASAMIAASATTPGINLMRVGTQLANIASLRAYQKAGFVITGAEHVWHCHTAMV